MSTVVPSPVAALRFFLLAEERVTDLVGQRIYGEELPLEDAPYMPRACVVIGSAGRGFTDGSNDQTSTIITPRLDVRCYGKNPLDADALARAVYLSMHSMLKPRVGEAQIYANTNVDGPHRRVDPQTDWQYTEWTYLLRMDNRQVVAA